MASDILTESSLSYFAIEIEPVVHHFLTDSHKLHFVVLLAFIYKFFRELVTYKAASGAVVVRDVLTVINNYCC